MNAIQLIKAERERQISAEGYSAEHNDLNETGHQLAMAAATYAWPGMRRITAHMSGNSGSVTATFERTAMWPWEMVAYKPERERMRELAKAGALIVAEMERIQRRIDAMQSDSENTD